MAQTIEEYLQILDNYTFSLRTISRAMGTIAPGTNVSTLTEESKDLAEAKMWDAASGLSSGGGGSVKFGLQSKTEATITVTDEMRLVWANKAAALRAKWGVVSDTDSVNTIYDVTELW